MAFLGTARAGRAAAATPLVVVVLAVATAAFCAVIATGIEATRDDVATRAVPADALIRGDRLAPDTGPALERLPGVRAATGLADESAQRLATDAAGTDARLRDTSVLLVDGPGLARTCAGRRPGRPGARPAARRPAAVRGPLPAVVSPAVAADLADAGLRSAFVTVQGQRYEFTAGRHRRRLPAGPTEHHAGTWCCPGRRCPGGTVRRCPPASWSPATGSDAGALRRAGDEGQHRYQTGGAVTGRDHRGVAVQTWSQTRAAGWAAVAPTGCSPSGSPPVRWPVGCWPCSRSRSPCWPGPAPGARCCPGCAPSACPVGSGGVCCWWSWPRWWGSSVLTGALVGVLLPVLLTPLLGLPRSPAARPCGWRFEPGLVAAAVGLGAVALGFAMAVEALNNRRMRLGEVLRLGEES